VHRRAARTPDEALYVKRDDCSGLATGGNNTRKLEYLMGEALA
jgi:L-cysteate sulfo-lyase